MERERDLDYSDEQAILSYLEDDLANADLLAQKRQDMELVGPILLAITIERLRRCLARDAGEALEQLKIMVAQI
jgi:hypothetical protein